MKVDVDGLVKEKESQIESGLIAVRDEYKTIHEYVKRLDGRMQTMDEYMKEKFEAKAEITDRRAGLPISADALALMALDAAKLPKAEPGKKFSVCRAIMAVLNPIEADANGCGYELEQMRSTRKSLNQALTLDVGSTGGFLVPTQQLPELIEQLKAQTVVRAAGARIMSDLAGSPVTIPRQSGAAVAQWISAGTKLTNSQQTFQQVSLSVKRLAALTVLDNLTLRMSIPSLDEIVEGDLSSQLALGVDIAALRGDGTAGTPLGVRFTPGIQTLAIGGSQVPTVANLQRLERLLNDANAPNRRRGWIMAPRSLETLQNILDASSRPILAPTFDPSPGKVQTILTYPFFTTTQIPTNLGAGTDESEIYFGDWSELLIGEWGAMEIMASNIAGDSFAQDETMVRAILYTDVVVRHAASFAVITDAQVS